MFESYSPDIFESDLPLDVQKCIKLMSDDNLCLRVLQSKSILRYIWQGKEENMIKYYNLVVQFVLQQIFYIRTNFQHHKNMRTSRRIHPDVRISGGICPNCFNVFKDSEVKVIAQYEKCSLLQELPCCIFLVNVWKYTTSFTTNCRFRSSRAFIKYVNKYVTRKRKPIVCLHLRR